MGGLGVLCGAIFMIVLHLVMERLQTQNPEKRVPRSVVCEKSPTYSSDLQTQGLLQTSEETIELFSRRKSNSSEETIESSEETLETSASPTKRIILQTSGTEGRQFMEEIRLSSKTWARVLANLRQENPALAEKIDPTIQSMPRMRTRNYNHRMRIRNYNLRMRIRTTLIEQGVGASTGKITSGKPRSS